ncbi:MAG: hypothetical protein AAF806_02160 [Bacteroidota bacterium]
MNDKFHAIIQKLIDQHQPESKEELQELLNSLVGQSIYDMELPDHEKTDADKAQELVWEAYELPIDKGRRRAKKALKLDPDCIAAHEYIGNTYQYYHKRGPHFEKGVEIGRRIFGGDFLKTNKGHFWGVTETRPFMRCLGMLAECYYNPGQTTKAIEIWKEMLELNPNDNQGMRYNLLAALLEQRDLKSYEKYRKEYDDEDSSFFLFSDALKAFIEEGDTTKSRQILRAAIGSNKYVVPIMTSEYPPEEYPDSYGWGNEDQAIIYAHMAWRAWRRNDGARDWMKKYGRA